MKNKICVGVICTGVTIGLALGFGSQQTNNAVVAATSTSGVPSELLVTSERTSVQGEDKIVQSPVKLQYFQKKYANELNILKSKLQSMADISHESEILDFTGIGKQGMVEYPVEELY